MSKRGRRKPQAQSPALKRQADSTAEVIAMLTAGNRSASGASVTTESALTFSAVLACVRVLAESVASLPLITYRRLPNDGKERAADHPLYTLLHDAPNEDMTSFQWRETSMAHCVLWGNAYSEITTDGAGNVRGLTPLMPQNMKVERVGGRLVYKYRDPLNGEITYPADRIFHVPGLSLNGVVGMSMIAIAREAIGLGLTLNEYGSRTFANGARPSGVLEHPGVMGKEAYDRLRDSFNDQYAGAGNAGKTLLLEEGTKFSPNSFPPEDAQFLQSRKFQIEEVARMFRVPLPFVGDLDRATFSNIEQLSLNFVIYTLMPWLVRWEQAISLRLLMPQERGQYFSKFLVDGLLRGDIASRYQAYSIGRNWGWLSADDVRRKEDENPLPNGSGQVYLTPLNMQPAGQGQTP